MLSGTFLADFQEFDAACRKTADEELPKIQFSAGRVEYSLNKMSGAGEGQINTLRQSFSQFDHVLQASGVNVRAEVNALDDLASASGKSAAQLGAVATAGLVVGAAMAGWNLGRRIADWLDLDAKVAHATDSLLGLGIAEQVAGAEADALARASKFAGHEITNVGLAYAINTEAVKDHREAVDKSAAVVNQWRGEIAKVGVQLPALTADLASQNFALKDLAVRYNVTVEALQFFQREQLKTAEAVQTATAIIQGNQAKLWDTQKQLDANKAAALKKASDDHLAQLKAQSDAATQAEEDWRHWGDTAVDALTSAIAPARSVSTQMARIGDEALLSAEKVRTLGGEIITLAENERRQHMGGTIPIQGQETMTQEELNKVHAFIMARQQASGGRIPDQVDIDWFVADVIRQRKKTQPPTVAPILEALTLPGPGGGGGGAVIQNTFHIVDTEANIVRRVSEAITQQILRGTRVPA